MKIIRVFPRRTKATPVDNLAYYDIPDLLTPEVEEIHISVTFTWDMKKAEELERSWKHVASVKMGGPVFNKPGGDFVPGMYLKPGYVITSRGCPNSCWFCSVHKREKGLKELPITEGNNILDDNLLACSEQHVKKVFDMLRNQKYGPVEFTGGIEAKILKPWHVDLLASIKLQQMFLAYDTPDDWEPLVYAAKMLNEANISAANRKLRAYVLIGYPKDTIEEAEKRLNDTLAINVMPMAMLWRNEQGTTDLTWRRFQREWARPAIIANKLKALRE